MLDNQLFKLIISTINTQLTAAGIPNTALLQSYQPTMQGALTNPAAYIHKLGDIRTGWPYRNFEFDTVAGVENATESEVYQTMFQISTLVTQIAGQVDQLTASDYLNLIAYILQSSATIAAFAAQGVGMLDIQKVDNPYFNDDRGRWESSPNLTFTLTHTQTISTTVDFTDTVTFNLLPVQ